jgi:hypothetical protein
MHDDDGMTAEGGELRRAVRPRGQDRLGETDDGAAEIYIDRCKRAEHVLG